MELIRLNYQFHRDASGFIDLRPICTVAILNRERRIPLRVLVDSGASDPVFPRSAAVEAGLNLSRGTPVAYTFVGGTGVGTRVRDVYLKIRQRRIRTDVVFFDDQIIASFGLPLLGRRTVFAQFNEVVFLEKTNPMRVELR